MSRRKSRHERELDVAAQLEVISVEQPAEFDRLMIDVWTRAGEELLEVDPGRCAAILAVVRDIVAIHRDPIGAKADEAAPLVAALRAKPARGN